MLTIDSDAPMRSSAALAAMKEPTRLTSRISRNSSALVSSAGRSRAMRRRIDQPADQAQPVDDLHRRRRRPRPRRSRRPPGRSRSHRENAFSAAQALASSASITATGQPSSSRRFATAMPMPEAPPVTIGRVLHLMRSRMET